MSVSKNIKNLTAAAMCLALCMLLPFITWQNVMVGNMFSLMHIPVLLCGFICGPLYGAAVGFIAPLLRHFTLGSPPMPICIAMAFELAVYGAATGCLYKLLPKKGLFVYVSLVSAMLANTAVIGFGLAIYDNRPAALVAGILAAALAIITWRAER